MLEDSARVHVLDATIPGGLDPSDRGGLEDEPGGDGVAVNPQGPSGITKVRVRSRSATPGGSGSW